MTDKQMLNIISELRAQIVKCQQEIAKLRGEFKALSDGPLGVG